MKSYHQHRLAIVKKTFNCCEENLQEVLRVGRKFQSYRSVICEVVHVIEKSRCTVGKVPLVVFTLQVFTLK